MRKLFAVSFLFLGIQSSVIGQGGGGTVTLGPELKDIKYGFLDQIIGVDDNGFYASRLAMVRRGLLFSREFTLESYNLNMEKTNSVPLDINSKEKRVIHNNEFMLTLNNKLYSFDSKMDLNTKLNTLKLNEINKSTLGYNGDEKNLAEMSFEDQSRYNVGSFKHSLSLDSSKLLVAFELPFEKGQPEKFGFKVFDDNLEELWNYEIELPYNDDLFDFMSFEVSNEGKVYLLGKIYEDVRLERKKGEINYNYHLFIYSKEKKFETEIKLDSKGKILNEIFLTINNTNQVSCIGLYANELKKPSVGSYSIQIDSKTQKVLSENFKEFKEIDEVVEVSDESEEKSDKKKEREEKVKYRNYDLRQINHKKDGGMILVAEQYYLEIVTKTTTNGSGGTSTSTSYHYHYDNILVLNIDKNGNFIWQKIIKKNQETINDDGRYSSFALGLKDENLVFIYNTTEFNKKKNGEDSRFYKKNNFYKNLSIVTLDKKGNLSEKVNVLDRVESKVVICPKKAEQISKNQLIIFGVGKKTNRFGMLTLD